ncbi:MAG: SMC-Scp complex subunit ScpB [Mycoplasmataceae bacterium]|jgi:segregation and condensation protein B|nr:SMC-Scp complex subunit ScpB [Mycoplasmataceae bacterium]
MNVKSIIESILYVSGNDGIDVNDIKKVVNLPADEIRKVIKEIQETYKSNPDSGFTIKAYGAHFYLLTKTENKEFISKLIDVRLKNPLTPAVMETLAIIAYNSPCTGVKIDEIRGTSSDGALKRLESLGLIVNSGRAETPGRPYLYEVTQKFFNLFGIKSLNDLPKINQDSSDLENVDFFNANRFEEDK